MRSGPNRPKPKVEANLTLDAVAPEELMEGPPAAERWILTEIKRMRAQLELAESHRRRAMAGIAERFQQRLAQYCRAKLGHYRDEAEDIVQEVYQDVEALLEKVVDEQHLRNLIFRVAKNKCIDAVNRGKRLELSDEINALAPEEPEYRGVDPELLRRAIKNLPKLEDRILLTLSLDFRMPTRDIATVLEITEGACKMRRHRARLKLRTLLEELGVHAS